MRFKRMLLCGALAAFVVGASSSYALANDENNSSQPTAEEKGQYHHHGHHGKHHVKLTDEQKAALKQAGVDFETLKQNEKQLRTTIKSIHEQGEVLKDATKDNEALQKQLQADMQPIKKNFQQLRDLRKANRQLKETLRDAATAKDTAKIKETYSKLVANQQEALKLLQTIDAAMQAEVKKIKG